MKIHQFFSISLAASIIISCSNQAPKEEVKSASLEQNTYSLNVPVLLSGDTNTVHLSDFYKDVNAIDSLVFPPQLIADWKKGQNELVLIGQTTDWIAPIYVYSKGEETVIMLRNAAIETVNFEFDPKGNTYTTVDLVGDLNGWSAGADAFEFDGTIWKLTKKLNPGGYPYQLSVDGKYILDPSNPDSVSNGFGGFNSFLKVEASNVDKIPHIQLASADENNVTVHSSVLNQGFYALWENQIIAIEDGAISFKIPAAASELQRSFVRVWAQTKEGLSNELRIPLENGKVISSTSQLTRNDKERSIMYFMLVDRFVNGDSSIDAPVNDDRIKPRANYYGGDIAGIEQKLEAGYFDELGINTLWISPISQNPEGAYQEYPEPRRWFSGYHGYWPMSFKKVDHRFGSNQTVKDLVKESHDKNYNIILDYVCNHVHEEHPIIKQHPDWKTTLDLPDGRRNLRIWDEFRLTTWFDDFLPTLDYSIPEVSHVMSDSAVWWIEEFGFDGFRHDATKHIPESFWREATLKLKALGEKTGKNYFQVGETFGSRELIQSYIGSGMMDGQFDFNLYFDAVSVFKDTTASMSKLAESMQASMNLHGSLHQMCNITGNHDLTRFITLASHAVSDNEDQKEAGWKRDIKVEDPIGYEKLKMLETFIMTIPGIPVIFYGDEIGMPGANDPDNRRMMRFDNLLSEEQAVKEHVKTITNIRSNHMALNYGDVEINEASDAILVFTRTYLNDVVVTLFNNSDKPKTIEVPFRSAAFDLLNKEISIEVINGKAIVKMPAFTSQIIYTKA